VAAYDACGEPVNSLVDHQPFGIYTIPEISYCGQAEDLLTRSSVPYEVGISRYRELARGQIIGDSYGMLKLLVSTQTRQLLGVHVFGSHATELVHLGQAIMTCQGTVDQLVDTVFNYPTLSEAYKIAALDAVNKLRAVAQLGGIPPAVPAEPPALPRQRSVRARTSAARRGRPTG
jgi:NAD(P) transhydrogenase